jgi:hypothetical protein
MWVISAGMTMVNRVMPLEGLASARDPEAGHLAVVV